LRVGAFVGNAHTPGNPDAQAAIDGALALLASLGHDVHNGYPDELDDNVIGSLLGMSVAASVAHELDIIEAHTGSPVPPDGVEPATWTFAEHGRSLTARQYLTNLDAMHRYARRIVQWWDHNDILVTPTMSEPAPPIGELKGADVERIVRLVPYTAPYNITGQPAIALPLHWTTDGLPLGVQLVARYGEEDLLIRLASQIEAAAPWIDRRPPVCA
jgi:amidase